MNKDTALEKLDQLAREAGWDNYLYFLSYHLDEEDLVAISQYMEE